MSGRVRCAACGTEQEAPAAGRPGSSCVGCGRPLDTAAGPAIAADVPGASAPGQVYDLHEQPGVPLAVPPQDPRTRPTELDELDASAKQTLSLLALVPLWGAWKLWRSDLHSLAERVLLSAVSVLLAVAVAVAAWSAIPTAAAREARTAAEVETRIRSLATLVERYRREQGAFPDEETWRESTERRDPRFRDPWERPYVYREEEAVFTIGTYGADGKPGGRGLDRDVFLEFRKAPD